MIATEELTAMLGENKGLLDSIEILLEKKRMIGTRCLIRYEILDATKKDRDESAMKEAIGELRKADRIYDELFKKTQPFKDAHRTIELDRIRALEILLFDSLFKSVKGTKKRSRIALQESVAELFVKARELSQNMRYFMQENDEVTTRMELKTCLKSSKEAFIVAHERHKELLAEVTADRANGIYSAEKEAELSLVAKEQGDRMKEHDWLMKEYSKVGGSAFHDNMSLSERDFHLPSTPNETKLSIPNETNFPDRV